MLTSHNSLAVKGIFVVFVMLVMIIPAHAKENGDQLSTGKNIYTQICGHCHDVGVGTVIKGRQLPSEYISHIVRNGLRAMPAFPESYISRDDLESLGRYIQQSTREEK